MRFIKKNEKFFATKERRRRRKKEENCRKKLFIRSKGREKKIKEGKKEEKLKCENVTQNLNNKMTMKRMWIDEKITMEDVICDWGGCLRRGRDE